MVIVCFTLLLSVFTLPHIQSLTGFMQERPLHGYSINHTSPKLTLASWFNRSFQDTMEIYLKDSISLKPTFVRIRNQVDYLLFQKLYAQNVRIEKEGHFFRYTNYFVGGGNYPGNRNLEKNILKLKSVQDSLRKKNKKLLFIIAPDKLWFDKEFLINENVLNEKSTKFYDKYLFYLRKYNCDFIDLNAAFIRIKSKEKGLLFSKGGYHWTEFGASLAMDSIAAFLRDKWNLDLTLVKKELMVNDKPGADDLDMIHACNLQFMPGLNEKYTHSNYVKQGKTSQVKALLCGDSFCQALCWTKYFWQFFSKESTFWYYNREIYDINNNLLGKADEEIADSFIEKSDIYIVLFSAGNLEKFEYGFLDHFVK